VVKIGKQKNKKIAPALWIKETARDELEFLDSWSPLDVTEWIKTLFGNLIPIENQFVNRH
jgi:hypothetical protein